MSAKDHHEVIVLKNNPYEWFCRREGSYNRRLLAFRVIQGGSSWKEYKCEKDLAVIKPVGVREVFRKVERAEATAIILGMK